MTKARTARAEWPILPATAAGKGLGSLRIGSSQSRAAARLLLTIRRESEAEGEWDRELDFSDIDLAGLLDMTRKRIEQVETPKRDWSPIPIPLGKEDTVRGRLYARINAAAARIRQYEAR